MAAAAQPPVLDLRAGRPLKSQASGVVLAIVSGREVIADMCYEYVSYGGVAMARGTQVCCGLIYTRRRGGIIHVGLVFKIVHYCSLPTQLFELYKNKLTILFISLVVTN